MAKIVKEELQEAVLWRKERNGVRCELCAVNCFIAKEKLGACLVRKNVNNKLFTMNYGRLTAINIDEVERRPLYHFMPGSKTLAIAGQGNDDWQIYTDRLPKAPGKEFTPESVVKMAEKEKVQSISYTHAEPTIFFEFVFKTAKLAARSNIKNIFVTNGVITEEPIKRISKYVNAMVVNFVGSGDPDFMSKYSVIPNAEPIMKALKQMKKQRMHIEITNTIIPQIGDNVEKCRKLCEWIAAELMPTIPFHILQFHPTTYTKFSDLPFTPIATLEKCAEEARKAGLRYVYIGNTIEPHEGENTFCYNCRELLVQRVANKLKKNSLLKDRCPNCGVRIDVVVQ